MFQREILNSDDPFLNMFLNMLINMPYTQWMILCFEGGGAIVHRIMIIVENLT